MFQVDKLMLLAIASNDLNDKLSCSEHCYLVGDCHYRKWPLKYSRLYDNVKMLPIIKTVKWWIISTNHMSISCGIFWHMYLFSLSLSPLSLSPSLSVSVSLSLSLCMFVCKYTHARSNESERNYLHTMSHWAKVFLLESQEQFLINYYFLSKVFTAISSSWKLYLLLLAFTVIWNWVKEVKFQV